MCSSSSSSDPGVRGGPAGAGPTKQHPEGAKKERERERGGDEEEGGGSEMRGLDVKTESVLSAGLDSRWLAAPPRMAALTASGTRCCLCHGWLAGWLQLPMGGPDGLSVQWDKGLCVKGGRLSHRLGHHALRPGPEPCTHPPHQHTQHSIDGTTTTVVNSRLRPVCFTMAACCHSLTGLEPVQVLWHGPLEHRAHDHVARTVELTTTTTRHHAHQPPHTNSTSR